MQRAAEKGWHEPGVLGIVHDPSGRSHSTNRSISKHVVCHNGLCCEAAPRRSRSCSPELNHNLAIVIRVTAVTNLSL